MSNEVVGLGAYCDLVRERPSSDGPYQLSFDVDEFALLADGRRVMLHQGERGFTTTTPDPLAHHPLRGLTAESIESSVRTVVLPDEDDPEDEHPYEWLCELLRAHGVAASTESLRALPYTVVFSERLRRMFAVDE